jgi:hypothetical protein
MGDARPAESVQTVCSRQVCVGTIWQVADVWGLGLIDGGQNVVKIEAA